MPDSDEFILLLTDQNLNVLGDPIANWTNLDCTLRFNEPSSGMFTVPGGDWIREQLIPGARVVVNRYTYDGQGSGIFISGPVEQWLEERSDNGENAGEGKITVNFADDLAPVVARLTYPNPAQTPETQTTDVWTYTGNAEAALRELVNKNAGPGALTARQVPTLALGTLASVGTSVTVTAQRMQPLGEVAREIARIGGGLGFRTEQVGSQILFVVYDPPDKSDEVRFSFAFGNLKYLAYEVTAPKATVVVAGGQGEGTDRNLYERINAGEVATWGRYEKLQSTAGTDATAAQDEGDKALAENAATVRIPSNVADTDQARFGVHYGLGDLVAIENRPGNQLVDAIRSVHLQAWPTSGSIISATVGDQSAQTDLAWAIRIRELEERLGQLERIVVPAVP